MLAAITPITALLVSCFVLIMGQGLSSTLIQLGGAAHGFPERWIGLIGSAYFVGMLAGAYAAPFILRAAGHIRAFAALAAISTVAVMALPMLVSPIGWLGLRIIHGFCIAALYACIEGWLNARTANDYRARVLSFYNLIHFAGSGLGQQAVPLAPATDSTLYMFAAMAISLSVLPLAFTRSDPPEAPPARTLRLGWLYRVSPVGAVAAGLIGWANGSFWSLGAVQARTMGFSPAEVATFLTVVIAGCAAAQFPTGWFGDRHDRRIILAAFAALGMVSQIGLAMADSKLAYAVCGFFLGMAMPSIYVMNSAHANDRAGREHAVEVASAILFLYCCGALVGPVMASWLMETFGQRALYWHNAFAHGTIVVFVVWRLLRRAAPIIEPGATKVPARIK